MLNGCRIKARELDAVCMRGVQNVFVGKLRANSKGMLERFVTGL